MTTVIIDTNVLVALVDGHDKWHQGAIALRDALLAAGVRPIYFDCVMAEAISVMGRRAEEQKRSDQFGLLLDKLVLLVPEHHITWISIAGQRLYQAVVELCREHQGRLNFNDALIALVSRELTIFSIASFDRDFDEIAWLTRIDDPVTAARLRPERFSGAST